MNTPLRKRRAFNNHKATRIMINLNRPVKEMAMPSEKWMEQISEMKDQAVLPVSVKTNKFIIEWWEN